MFFNTTVDRVFWGVCCERMISVHINWCRFFILLLIIYSGFHTEPWAVIFSDNAWQRQQDILKKLTKQPACTTTSFNSNSKSDSLCSWKVAFFRFQNIILSFIVFYFYAVGKILSQFKCCVVVHVNIFISFILMLSPFKHTHSPWQFFWYFVPTVDIFHWQKLHLGRKFFIV